MKLSAGVAYLSQVYHGVNEPHLGLPTVVALL